MLFAMCMGINAALSARERTETSCRPTQTGD